MWGHMGSPKELGSLVSRPAYLIARGSPLLSRQIQGNGTKCSPEVAVKVLRGLVFVAGILLGLAFAVACYAELLGIVHFE